jgi:hypothetical protein
MLILNGYYLRFLRTENVTSRNFPWFSSENLQFFKDDFEEIMKEFFTIKLGTFLFFDSNFVSRDLL